MKKIFYTILISLLFTSCSIKDRSDIDYKKAAFDTITNEDERKALENIANTKDIGVYKYVSYRTKDNSIIQELFKGKSKDKEFSIINNNDYFFKDSNTLTYANKEKNLYFQQDANANTDDSVSEEEFYKDLYDLGLNKVDLDSEYIILNFPNDSYSKYDSKTFDLLEDKFTSGGEIIIKKLESKSNDVEGEFDKNIKIIDGMKKAKTVGEVTGNE